MKQLTLDNISLGYNKNIVLNSINAQCTNMQPTCIMGASGAGKTTLINILLGLVKPDSGAVLYEKEGRAAPYRVSAVFQETRLVEHLNPVINTAMVLDGRYDKKAVRSELSALINEAALDMPCSKLSGGMKRRVEIVRAMLPASDIVIMDEPFAGLDKENKVKAIQYIIDNLRERILIIATHDRQDAVMLNAKLLMV